MKASQRGSLSIEMDGNNNPKVRFEPVNGTIWIHKSELPALFGASQQMINACVDSIFKAGLFTREEVSRYDLYVSGKRVKYDLREFRLEVIISLAFRIHSPRAGILRKWVVEQCSGTAQINFQQIDTSQNYSLN